MEGFAYWPLLSIGVSVLSAATLYIWQVRQGKDKLSADTFKKMNEALDVRETTINDLREEIAQKEEKHLEEIRLMQERHATEIKGLQTQITSLQAQITALTGKNKVLEDAVTGRVYLEQIIGMLTAFQPLLEKNGILEEFKRDHAATAAALEDIKLKLGITNRHEDSNGANTPRNQG